MPLIKIAPGPGLFRDGTLYSAEGRWFDCDMMRFRKGFPEKIGGWQKLSIFTFMGSGRALHDWGTIGGSRFVGLGTNLKLYVNEGSSYYDITPIRIEDNITLGTDPLDTTINSGEITINHTSHSVVPGDYVTLSGVNTVGGITTGYLNIEHRVNSVTDANSYVVGVGFQATSSVSGGGSSVVVAPQINIGLDVFVPGSGWGAGTWGGGSWGSGSLITAAGQLRLWTLDNFGDDLIAQVRQGGLYYWDESSGVDTRAIPIDQLTRRSLTLTTDPIATVNVSNLITITDKGGHGAGVGDAMTISGSAAVNGIPAGDINKSHTINTVPTDTTFTLLVSTNATSTGTGGASAVIATYDAGIHFTPSISLQAMVSNTARHVIVFGANDVGSLVLDPMLVRWCSSENAADWEPRDDNSAGGQRLSSGSVFVGAIRTRQEHIIWTDVGMISMRYSGAPFYFSFTEVAKNISMMSPNAAVNANGVIFFMDRGGFYSYTGAVRKITCPVRDYVFGDFNFDQSAKVVAGTNIDFSEVKWFYPSLNSNEVDRYVKYNYDEDLWDFGILARGAWSEAPTRTYPMSTSLRKEILGNDPIATVSGSPVITITQTGHRLSVLDEIIMNDAGSVGGLSIAVLNSQHIVVTIVDDDSYTVDVTDDASSTATGGGAIVQVRSPNYIYEHEIGHDADGLAMTAYIESADFDLQDGDDFVFASKLIPDVDFRDNTDPDVVVTISLIGHDYPGQAQAQVSTSDITPSTEQAFIRARNRMWAIKAQSVGIGYGWRLGHTRIDVRPDGKR